ncbi:glycosyltransferase [Aciduricibacillus chroicocephali]|uniref:Glycosyltransferase n=1 Tax=Aciduricibacillus chroicocephali TaxID=3054939 RepID=A0ABY9KXH2_9BACI|nr:glycosyltransferase [Bacillaceae bacterium 44XB]
MKRICYLAGASTIHTVRWVNAMVAKGYEVHLITMHPAKLDQIDSAVSVHKLKVPAPIGYYANVFQLKRLLREINPELLHVHYASGYGTLARLAKFSPTLLSTWGSDVYLFPYESKRNEKTLRKNFMAATRVSATGLALKRQTALFTPPDIQIDVVPFGIDTELFRKIPIKKESGDIVIGTVKRLKEVYGIDLLLKSVARMIDQLHKEGLDDIAGQIKLLIVGEGPQISELKEIAVQLRLEKQTEFVGAVPNVKVPEYINQLDIYCAFSRSESFGVAILEASACEVPVVVSNVGGLPEVVRDGESGYITQLGDLEEMAERIKELVLDEGKRKEFGRNGREFVQSCYEWDRNVAVMADIYEQMTN